MSGRKTEFKFFTIPEYAKEEKYLREMHKKGWKLDHIVFPGFYEFEKCEPEDVVYQLDYNPEGRNHHSEYAQMFGDCGWEYMMDFVGYSYFRKPVAKMKEQEEIFSDDESRLEMIKRVWKGRMIPLLCIFFGIIIPQMFMQFRMGGEFGITLFVIFGIMFVLYLVMFSWFGIQYWKLRRKLR